MTEPDRTFHARVHWTATDAPFTAETFDRDHVVTLAGGIAVPSSSAPEFHGHGERTNPEELIAAALSSCHMLTFLTIAARKRLTVTAYDDDAVSTLGKLPDGHLAVTSIELRPRVSFSGAAPSAEELGKLHEMAHRNCFIAGAIRASVTITPRDPSDVPGTPS